MGDQSPTPRAVAADAPRTTPVSATLSAMNASPVTVRVGDPLPDVALVDHDGRPWRTGDQRGRPLVLVLHRHLA